MSLLSLYDEKSVMVCCLQDAYDDGDDKDDGYHGSMMVIQLMNDG